MAVEGVHETTMTDANGMTIHWAFEVIQEQPNEVPIISLTGTLVESDGMSGALQAFIPVPILRWMAAHFEEEA